jgi:flavin reductase (DIM6/NTAB) family NADH-FMN oxidoreductase RutF
MQNNELAMAMRLGMRRLASGVCVLSTQVNEVERFAMTVSSVTSVSDSPASLLVCINQLVSKQEHLSSLGSRFAINVLGVEHRGVSDLCAGREPERDRFTEGCWAEHGRLPILADAPAVFICETDKVTQYGTHHIIVALIKDVIVREDPGSALLYAHGGYGSFVPTPSL